MKSEGVKGKGRQKKRGRKILKKKCKIAREN